MKDETIEPETMDDLPELRGLLLPAPQSAFLRFRRRAGLMQGGKLLVESQVVGFWLVLDTLLKRLFRSVPSEPSIATTNRSNLHQGGTGEKA